MAETLQKLGMYAFRGIPTELELSPRGRSLLIYGGNGTGKSTIADALEWYFTGQIDYLTREGRSEGVRHAGSPGDIDTHVEIETDGGLSGIMSTHRSPPDEALAAGARETFLLRGRTLADFVDRTKGEKWKALAEVLGIEKSDDLRADLHRAHRLLRDSRRTQEEELDQRQTAVADATGGSTDAELLAAIQHACQEAAVEPPVSLQEALDPAWKQRRVPVDPTVERNARLEVLNKEVEELSPPEEPAEVEVWNEFVTSDAVAVEPRIRLFAAAQDLATGSDDLSACPLVRSGRGGGPTS